MFAFFIGLHCTMLTLRKLGLLSDVLASRPTLVANNLHCTTVQSACIAYSTMRRQHRYATSWRSSGPPSLCVVLPCAPVGGVAVVGSLLRIQVSVLAVYLIWTGDGTRVESYKAWQEWGIPISVAYFVADTVW